MTRSLRRRHRTVVLLLGVLLPAAFAAGIAARRPTPVMTARANAPDSTMSVVWQSVDLWSGYTIQTRLLSATAGIKRYAVDFPDAETIVRPDTLVYWLPIDSVEGGDLPDSAVLLGPLVRGGLLELPGSAIPATGMLAFYSLADHELIGVSRPFTVRDR